MMVILVMIRFSQLLSKQLESVEGEHKKVKDKRINVTTETLEGIKLIKVQSWEQSFLQHVSGIQCDEVR